MTRCLPTTVLLLGTLLPPAAPAAAGAGSVVVQDPYLVLSYSHKPMRLFGGVGLGLGFSGSALLLYLFVRPFASGVPVLGSPVFQIAIMLLILGSQSMLMGLMAELLGRTYHDSQKKLTYTVRETIPPGHANDPVARG